MWEVTADNPCVHAEICLPVVSVSVTVNLIRVSVLVPHKYYHLMKELKFNYLKEEHQRAHDIERELVNLKIKAGKSFSEWATIVEIMGILRLYSCSFMT